MAKPQPASLDIGTLRRAYQNGFSPTDLIEMIYNRFEDVADPGIFISRLPIERALNYAQNLGEYKDTLPLYGVPFAIKDNIDFVELPTTAGCSTFSYQPRANAFVVERLIAAGAIPIGKANLDQFATGLVGTRTPWPVPHNAFDSSLVPGGSSSGSAVAVARGLVSFALGTDTAGSGRVPAALNNIVGLKPTHGAISIRGVVPACRSLDCVSIFALTVDDAYEVFMMAAGYDRDEPFSRHVDILEIGSTPSHIRMGVPDSQSRHFAGDAFSEAAFDNAIDLMRSLGAEVIPIDMSPFFAAARLLYDGPWVAERYHAVRTLIETKPDALLPVTRKIISGADRYNAVDVFDAFYKLSELKRITSDVWCRIDALATPTFPRPCRLDDLALDPILPNSELGVYTNFVNLLDLCGLAVPGPFRDDGLPAGVTFLAPAGKDGILASFGAKFHHISGVQLGATGAQQPIAPPRPCATANGDCEIAVVGAHLSGMALNGELVELGARLMRKVRTKPEYKLFALAGGPPFRPGLLRVVSGEGVMVETEVWAMSALAFGKFINDIPAPLGVGTINLEDGSTPKGVLVESIAVEGARDISHFGGWRAYVAAMTH